MDEKGGMISFLWDINETRCLFGLIDLFVAGLFEERKKYSIIEHDQNFSSPSNKLMPSLLIAPSIAPSIIGWIFKGIRP
jgi:hypothetical protein